MQQVLQNQAAFMQGRFIFFPYAKDSGIADFQVGMVSEYDNQSMDAVMKPPPPQPRFVDGMYSSSGFDMIEILVGELLFISSEFAEKI